MQSTFLSKKRTPYSYITHNEAPPIGIYSPKYGSVDKKLMQASFKDDHYSTVEKRQSVEHTPACMIVGGNECTLVAR